uniref:Uncharacterized protein n=1 Tax=viral metagenome TaxID=1070528 RepID=A0A6C0LZ67_9ZZZZ
MSTQEKTHPEWEKEHSLTSPQDRDRKAQWRPEQGAPALSEEEVSLAIESLDNNDFTKKFPRVDRTYADPPISLQTVGLISFTPAKGATPNENGVFGFAKLRGNYASELEAKQRAETIIRTIDSYHQIYHTYVGRPFPVTDSSKYSADTDEIEIRKDMAKSVSASIKNKKGKDKKDMDEIKEREEILLAESRQKPEDVDPYENYITLKVKKAQLSWTYLEHIKKMAEVKEIIIKTRKTLDKIDASNPEFQDKYLEKYMKARTDVGLDLNKSKSSDNFLKFLVEEVELPGIDDIISESEGKTKQ